MPLFTVILIVWILTNQLTDNLKALTAFSTLQIIQMEGMRLKIRKKSRIIDSSLRTVLSIFYILYFKLMIY